MILKKNGANCILGSGSYGTVFQANLIFSDNEEMHVAVKFPTCLLNSNYIQISANGQVSNSSPGDLKRYSKELELFNKEIDTLLILRKGKAFLPLTQPNQIIRSSQFSRAFSEEHRLIDNHKGHEFIHRILDSNEGIFPCLISEFCHGNLLQVNDYLKGSSLIQTNNLFTEDLGHWMNAVYEIYQGTSYMHSMGISHNDIKPDNIFFLIKSVSPLVITYRISDFGLCSDNTPLDVPRGTELYMSPETLSAYNNSDRSTPLLPFANDAYSFGFTCLELLFMSSTYSIDSSTSTSNTQNFIDKISKKMSISDTLYSIDTITKLMEYDGGNDACNVLFNLLIGLCVLTPNERLQVFDQHLSTFFTRVNHHN
jgi:serine/threonine protein kinase